MPTGEGGGTIAHALHFNINKIDLWFVSYQTFVFIPCNHFSDLTDWPLQKYFSSLNSKYPEPNIKTRTFRKFTVFSSQSLQWKLEYHLSSNTWFVLLLRFCDLKQASFFCARYSKPYALVFVLEHAKSPADCITRHYQSNGLVTMTNPTKCIPHLRI